MTDKENEQGKEPARQKCDICGQEIEPVAIMGSSMGFGYEIGNNVFELDGGELEVCKDCYDNRM